MYEGLTDSNERFAGLGCTDRPSLRAYKLPEGKNLTSEFHRQRPRDVALPGTDTTGNSYDWFQISHRAIRVWSTTQPRRSLLVTFSACTLYT